MVYSSYTQVLIPGGLRLESAGLQDEGVMGNLARISYA